MDITNMVATLGFPIVACVGLGLFINKIITKAMDSTEERESRILTELSKVNDTNDNLVQTNEEIVKTNSILVQEIRTEMSGIGNKLDNLKDEMRRK
ncbi:putative membrane protein [Gottschalkia acidurici 9a]|uniref:Membrane protein n=1 Tax=Gottschalkia acidurici (strain ATCC 7906 / DSM 604 / BCRC 14475 / CIP 104303 / KCTC 5404 / NCIMB 10678 / 9a) TaxID=1128398 RepID=K0B0D2_GOTA9|nr:hypothetical protein [Gottschalkia acidurici]AFS78517.1 putative membrane protein [Gottschalkia acidurici 9a]